MGKYSNGILGAFSGKIGAVVGSSWRGKHYMRAYTSKIRNPKTLEQVTQRLKISAVSKFIIPLRDVVDVGWKYHAIGMTASNAMTRYLLESAITGSYPNFGIDHEKVLISTGRLTGVENGAVNSQPGSTSISISWDQNTDTGSASPDDYAIIAAVNLQKEEAACITRGALRSEGLQTMTLPLAWVGNTVICYLGFVSKEKQKVSKSAYLGEMILG